MAFYESPPKDGGRVLRCHGPSSLSALTGETVELDVNTLAEAYLQEVKDGNNDSGWARAELWQSLRTDLARGFALVMLVLENAESDEIVEDIAAGALKDLFTEHGHNVFKPVARGCKYSRRLRLAVSQLTISPSDEIYSGWCELKSKYSVDT